MKFRHEPCLPSAYIPMPQRLIEALGRLQARTLNIYPHSVYVYDLLEQRILSSSCSVAAMLGYTSGAINALGLSELSALIHPHDVENISEHYQRFTTLPYGTVISIEYRMKHASGNWCWLRSQETTLTQAIDGFPIQILGLVQNLSHPEGNPSPETTSPDDLDVPYLKLRQDAASVHQ